MNPNDKVFFSLRADLEYSQELDSSTDVGRMEIAHELRILNEAIEGVFEGNAVYLQLNLRDLSALRDKLITRKVDINGRKVNYTIDPNGCWIPKNKPRKDKYVVISINGEQVYLHQESYKYFNGEKKPGYIVRHTCDNPTCFNPEHLRQGTKKDNTQDMLNHNRASDWHDRPNNRAKLTSSQHNEIKNSAMSSYKLAEVYGVSDVHIRRIKNGTRGTVGMQ